MVNMVGYFQYAESFWDVLLNPSALASLFSFLTSRRRGDASDCQAGNQNTDRLVLVAFFRRSAANACSRYRSGNPDADVLHAEYEADVDFLHHVAHPTLQNTRVPTRSIRNKHQ